MKEKYIEDLREIKDMMSRSSRFISLSGLAGVSTGFVALAGVYLSYQTFFNDQNYLVSDAVPLPGGDMEYLLFIALGTLTLSIVIAFFFTKRKIKKRKENMWTHQTKELLINLIIPLTAGGLLCLILLFKGFVGFLPPITLIFYGLALVNGSKYTLPEIRTLGLIEIVIGLVAFQFIEYGLILWALGFGVIQMIYGLLVQNKYKS